MTSREHVIVAGREEYKYPSVDRITKCVRKVCYWIRLWCVSCMDAKTV